MKPLAITSPLLLAMGSLLFACCDSQEAPNSQPDRMLHLNDKSYLDGYAPMHKNGDVNVVIEIPSGTTEKWEVTKPDGELRWEVRDGRPRMVQYLGYPGNYGMIPRTLLPKELGGDGDPLDVIVLGDAVPRGSIVQARIIGMMTMRDGGEQDDKLIAVSAGTPFDEVQSMDQLQKKFGGVTDILENWFVNYKGPGHVEIAGFVGPDKAKEVLEASIKAFSDKRRYEN